MDFNELLPTYGEQDFANEQNATERAERNWEARDSRDPQESDSIRSARASFEQARKEAAIAYQWPNTCDGTGVLGEQKIAADMTIVDFCKGCPACNAEEKLKDALWSLECELEIAAPPKVVPVPQWILEFEMAEESAKLKRKPAAAAETSTGRVGSEKEVA